jgi:hypothetical protein
MWENVKFVNETTPTIQYLLEVFPIPVNTFSSTSPDREIHDTISQIPILVNVNKSAALTIEI